MELTQQGLPIIDLSSMDRNSGNEQIAEQISKACEANGCFYIKNHGVGNDIVDNAFDDLRIFFSQSIDYKTKFVSPEQNTERGYQKFETHNVNAYMGQIGFPNDPVERLAFGPQPTSLLRPVASNIWPNVPRSLKNHVETYFNSLQNLSEKLMKLFSIAAKAPSENFFYERCCQGDHVLKTNFYPKNSKPRSMQSTRFAEHTDGTPFTILATDDSPGSLQVKNSVGQWINADPVPNSFFVNLGDFMAIWTNDKWKATVHRVVWPEKEPESNRVSLVFFIQANPGVIAECLPSCIEPETTPRYEPIVLESYVKSRMDRLVGQY